MPTSRISRFANVAAARTPTKTAAAKVTKRSDKPIVSTVHRGASAKPSRFAHMAAAVVSTSSRVESASAGARAVKLTGKSVTRAITPNEEADIRHDLTWFGRVRSDAERNVTPQQKRVAAKRMRKSAEAGIARSSAAYRQVR
jgi:uncharacterized protein YceH (UPF0502 family)